MSQDGRWRVAPLHNEEDRDERERRKERCAEQPSPHSVTSSVDVHDVEKVRHNLCVCSTQRSEIRNMRIRA